MTTRMISSVRMLPSNLLLNLSKNSRLDFSETQATKMIFLLRRRHQRNSLEDSLLTVVKKMILSCQARNPLKSHSQRKTTFWMTTKKATDLFPRRSLKLRNLWPKPKSQHLMTAMIVTKASNLLRSRQHSPLPLKKSLLLRTQIVTTQSLRPIRLPPNQLPMRSQPESKTSFWIATTNKKSPI